MMRKYIRNNKSNLFKFCLMICALLMFCIAPFSFGIEPKSVSAASSKTEVSKVYGDTSLDITANSRLGSNLEFNTVSATLANNSTIEYYVFNWSDLYRLNFELRFPSSSTSYSFNSYYIKSSVLEDGNFDAMQPAEVLYDIEDMEIDTQQNIITHSINYGIDAKSTTNTSTVGYGYGLYKFAINFNGTNDVIVYYFAILPDEIPENTSPEIAYYITKSNSLLTAYEFMITTNDFNYIESSKIHWYVIGESKDGIKYVLTQADHQALDKPENYNYIWENVEQTGQTFYFDSNGLEGTWTVYCKIEGTNITSNSIEVVTTKQWITPTIIYISIGVFCGLIILTLIITLIVQRKKEKIW